MERFPVIQSLARRRHRRQGHPPDRTGGTDDAGAVHSFREVFQSSVVATLLAEEEGVIIDANPAAHRLLGRAPGTLTGFTLAEAGLSRGSVEGGSDLDPRRVHFSHPDGRSLLLDCVSTAIRTDAGGERTIAWWISDVTERMTAEMALEEANKRVRQSERLETLGTLAGGLAHDFNNLLAPILGNLELALLDLPDGSTMATDLRTAHTAALRAAELASRLLHLSRPERDCIEAVKVQDLMVEVVALLTTRAGQPLDIVERIETECPSILGTRTQLHQVLFNLCKNAVQAMPGGGTLTVTVEFAESHVTLNARRGDRRDGGFVRVTISDTGTGMSPDVVDRAFDPFFTTKGEGNGSGLGLSMVKSIVSGCGGSIEVRSVPGKGSTFTLLFPVFVETLER